MGARGRWVGSPLPCRQVSTPKDLRPDGRRSTVHTVSAEDSRDPLPQRGGVRRLTPDHVSTPLTVRRENRSASLGSGGTESPARWGNTPTTEPLLSAFWGSILQTRRGTERSSSRGRPLAPGGMCESKESHGEARTASRAVPPKCGFGVHGPVLTVATRMTAG